jgi:hypothetical protein
MIGIALGLLAGCAHGPEKAGSSGPRTGAAEYYPLAVGNRWVYETTLLGEKGERTIEIVGQKNGYFVDSEGGELKADALGVLDPKRYLLRDPLEVGQAWKNVVSVSSAERYKITAVGVPCETPAGKFSDCVQVESTNRVNAKVTLVKRDTFAHGVGLVRIQTAMQAEGREIPQAEFVLKSFQLAGAK